MIGEGVGLLLRNLPVVLLILAIAVAATVGRGSFPERLLSWLLLLPIGIAGLWAGAGHIFTPEQVAAYIGWEKSPFQFEIGMADLAIGVTACMAFRRDHEFKAAAIIAAAIFLLGGAVGHVRQMVHANNFAAGNMGMPFYMDIICPSLVLVLLAIVKRGRARC